MGWPVIGVCPRNFSITIIIVISPRNKGKKSFTDKLVVVLQANPWSNFVSGHPGSCLFDGCTHDVSARKRPQYITALVVEYFLKFITFKLNEERVTLWDVGNQCRDFGSITTCFCCLINQVMTMRFLCVSENQLLNPGLGFHTIFLARFCFVCPPICFQYRRIFWPNLLQFRTEGDLYLKFVQRTLCTSWDFSTEVSEKNVVNSQQSGHR